MIQHASRHHRRRHAPGCRRHRTVALVILAAAAALLAAGARRAAAQAARSGTISGVVLLARNGHPIRFSLVTLSGPPGSGATLTDRRGVFAFREVPPGDYRLRLERIGFRRDSGVAVKVVSGARVTVTVRATPEPLSIPVSPEPSPVCYPGSLLQRDPTLAALWGEASKAARIRHLLDLAYRYRVDVQESLVTYRLNVRWGYTGRRDATHRLESTPRLAAELAAGGSFAGYGVGMDSTRLVSVSGMLEVLDGAFLRDHCLRELRDRSGERRLRFEPLNPDSSRTQLIGNILLNKHYVLQRIEFEYQRGGRAFARGRVNYGSGGLPDGQLRFASWIRVEIFDAPPTKGDRFRFSPKSGFAERATATVSYSHFVHDTTGVWW